MVECEYSNCEENTYNGSKFCILHHDIPNENQNDYDNIIEEKERTFQKKIEKNEYDFIGVKLPEINIQNKDIDLKGEDMDFSKSEIQGDVIFTGSAISGGTKFENSKIGGSYINFNLSDIAGEVSFDRCEGKFKLDFERSRVLSGLTFNGLNIIKANLNGLISSRIFFEIPNDSTNQSIVDFKCDRSQIGGFTFVGPHGNFSFLGSEINGGVLFNFSKDNEQFGYISFERAEIKGEVEFYGSYKSYLDLSQSKISKGFSAMAGDFINARFDDTEISESIHLNHSKIQKNISFKGSTFTNCDINRAEIKGNVNFDSCLIENSLNLSGAIIAQNLDLNNTQIMGKINFFTTQIGGGLNFENTKFEDLEAQEESSRKAKIIWESLGERAKSDEYYYLEMVAKRKQKNNKIRQLFEFLFIDMAFKYGTNPYRTIITWFVVILFFACVYSIPGVLNGANWAPDYLFFSIFSSVGFEYAQYTLNPQYQILVSAEIVIGTFIWAAFLVIFARKYMR